MDEDSGFKHAGRRGQKVITATTKYAAMNTRASSQKELANPIRSSMFFISVKYVCSRNARFFAQ